MEFVWTEKNINWFFNAGNTTNFYRRIADVVIPHIKEATTVLDVGCGLGHLASEFAITGYKVTCLDSSETAISVVKDRIQNESMSNIRTVHSTYELYSNDREFDVTCICYVMGLLRREIIENVLNRTRKYVVIVLPSEEIKNDFSIHDFYRKNNIGVESLRQTCCKDAFRLLESIKMPYKAYMVEAEFGQPFYSFDEGLEFFRYYYPVLREKHKEFEIWLKNKLQKYNNKGYYMPSIRKSTVLILDIQRRRTSCLRDTI